MRILLIILIVCFVSCTSTSRQAKPTTPAKEYTIRLDGSKSYDPDGQIVKYDWTQIGGFPIRIINPKAVITTATATRNGIYSIELKVTDNQGATGKDTSVIKL